jgi:hypothetical protein
VSEVFGGRGRRDPELEKAAQRRREAFARDIGDERGRAFAYQGPAQRRRWSGIIGIGLLLFAGLGAIPLLRGSDGGLVPRQCERPAIGTSAEVVNPGGLAAWQVAGPDRGEYVVALDSAEVTVDRAGAVSVRSGRLLAGPFRLSDCRSPQALFDAPAGSGSYEVMLFHRAAAGGYVRVAADRLKVGSTPGG